MTVTLVLGGQRSGKSAHAESLLAAAPAKTYIATASVRDGEMADRVRAHQDRRDGTWTTVEEPRAVADIIERATGAVLLDCLTLWLANVMEAGDDVDAATTALRVALANTKADVVLVSSEVGLGVIPDNALARAYADALGLLNQRIAEAASRVVFVAAGLPLILKDT